MNIGTGMDIQNSIVLITGAAIRVGRSIALYLAKKGANIAFSYYLESEPWQKTLNEIKDCGVEAVAIQTDIRYADQARAMVKAAMDKFGRIDVLVNSASIWLKAPFLEISEQDWDTALDVNLKGPFITSQAVARHMLDQKRGVIINITDLSAFQVWSGYAHHAASKAGLVSITKTMALELAPYIRVNAIAPGTVLLPDNASDEKIKWAVNYSALKRVGSPEDVARLIEFLIENEFITGSTYFVDGGRSIS